MISSLELARLCGVSQGTVDRALHARSGISPATRKRILLAAEKHGYIPNPSARELMGMAESSVVGLLLPDWSLRTPFFMDLVGDLSIQLTLRQLRLSLWLSPGDAPGFRATFIDLAARRQRALVVVLPPEDLELPEVIVRRQPVFSLLLPCTSPGVINVLPDEVAIGRCATRHLLELGHQRILHVTCSTHAHAVHRARAQGYAEAMTAAGLAPDIRWQVNADPAALIAEGVTAVFCHHDPGALSLIRAAREAGIAVPRQLSVLGVDHSPIMVAFEPSLSSVPYPFAGIAAQVVAHVFAEEVPALPECRVVPGLSTGFV